MIPNAKLRVVETNGVEANGGVVTGSFGLSLKNAASIMTILRDTLYSDKILAVIREYSANAWDSHRESGKPDVPIKVTLPTVMEPTLCIRDYGAGLTNEDVFTVFTQYGASTKRESDLSVGMLGIGSKSGFAYSDSFTVTSFNGGMKRTYVAVLDSTEEGVINLLQEEECGNETGLLIQVAVRPEDISEFTQKAVNLFQYFKPRPKINTTLPKLSEAQMALKEGVIYSDRYTNTGWVAIMGCIAYKIDLDELKDFEDPEGGVASFLTNLSGALYFNMGEILINASREGLKYTPDSRKVLISKFNLLVEEYVSNTLKDIAKGNFTPWERRVKAQVLTNLLLPIPEDSKDLVAGSVHLKGKIPSSIFIHQYKLEATSIRITEGARFILRDDKRHVEGFRLSSSSYLVKPTGKETWDQVEKDLQVMIDQAGLTGIPVVRLSTLQWYPKRRGDTGIPVINIKHRLKRFKLVDTQVRRPLSRNWEAEDRVPTKDDVFVIISNFTVREYDFILSYDRDFRLAKAFGATLPTIYGYKTTLKRPIKPADCLGVEYSEWAKGLAKSLYTPEVEILLGHRAWAEIGARHSWAKTDKKVLERLKRGLGDVHPITTLYERHLEGKKEADKSLINESQLILLRDLLAEQKLLKPSEAKIALDSILTRYEMLSLPNCSLASIWELESDKWIRYIKLVDSAP